MKTYLTLDVGGSAIKYALLQEDLTILEKSSVPTPMDTLENFIETIGKIYDQFQDQIDGMALSMPGIIDPERGYQYTGGALRYIDKLETVEVLKKRCPTNITIGNDAKCAANAEIGFGNLQDIQDGAVVILGTGIGGCLIKDHKVHTGKQFSAGEFSFIKTNNLDPFTWNHAWCTRNGISGLLQRVQEALETDKEYTGIEILKWLIRVMKKSLQESMLLPRKSQLKSLMYTLFLIVKKWLLVVVYLPNHYLLNSLIKI